MSSFMGRRTYMHTHKERERLVIGVTSFRCFAKYPHSEHSSSCDGLREREREREKEKERERNDILILQKSQASPVVRAQYCVRIGFCSV